METINTVNFEDLFDFSPEPVDQVASSGAGGGSGDSKSGEGTLSNSRNIKKYLEEGSSYDAVAASSNHHHHNAFADFDRVLAGENYLSNRESSPKLSVSVPANWSTSGGGGISSTTPPTASSSADTNKGFTVGSVGQLLNELPEAAAATAATSVPVVTKSKRGRKPGQKSLRTDMKTKLERSRQSARECRARKKLRYQYLDDLILEREKANEILRQELVKYQKWCHEIDKGRIPDGLTDLIKEFKAEQQQQQQQTP